MTSSIINNKKKSMKLPQQKIFSILHSDLICEHKIGGLTPATCPILHNHDGYEILIFLGGEANFYAESAGKRLSRGDIMCIAPYAFHCAEPFVPDNYDRILINITENLLKKISSKTSDLSRCFRIVPAGSLNILHFSEQELQVLITYAKQLQHSLQQDDFGQDVLTNALLTQILVTINRHASTNIAPSYHSIMPRLVTEIFSYIEEHICEDLSLETLSTHFHHNRDYLSRCFKTVAGVSIQQFIIVKRISLAQNYLRQGISLQDSCFMSGFHNYSNFSRTFTKQVGLSPKQYQTKILHY